MRGLAPPSLGRATRIVIILPLVVPCTWGAGRDYIVTPLLLVILLCFLLCIFSYGRFFLVDLVFLINSCSVNSCYIVVPMGGGKLRVFLLCHLDLFLRMIYVFKNLLNLLIASIFRRTKVDHPFKLAHNSPNH